MFSAPAEPVRIGREIRVCIYMYAHCSFAKVYAGNLGESLAISLSRASAGLRSEKVIDRGRARP